MPGPLVRSPAFSVAPPTRERRGAVDHGNAFFMTSEQGALMLECRNAGLKRGIHYLSMLTVNWEEMLWEAAGTAASQVADNVSFGGGDDEPKAKPPLMGKSMQDIRTDKRAKDIKG